MKRASSYLVICDHDEEYARALAEYFMQRKELDLQVQVCSSLLHLQKLAKRKKIEFLFIEERIPREERQQFRTKKTFILSEGHMMKIKDRGALLYKYQSGKQILDTFLLECADILGNKMMANHGWEKDKKVIGVFSPVHRIGKTSYCLKIGRELAEEDNVLYLNLEVYGGINGHFKETRQNLSDALYFARQDNGNLGLLLTTIVEHDQNLDFISPMTVSVDMKHVEASEWIDLVRRILNESIYEIIILDLDEAVKDVYDVLEVCTEVHLLTNGDPLSEAKIDQFKKELTLLKKDDVLKKLKTIQQKGVR